MVKKIIGGAVAALLTSSAIYAGGPEILPAPVYFQGFYIGATVGGHAAEVDQSAAFATSVTGFPVAPTTIGGIFVPTVPDNTTFAIFNGDLGDINAYGGVQGGANWVWGGRWLLGVVGFWEGSHGLRPDASSQQVQEFATTATTIPGSPIPTSVGTDSVGDFTLNTSAAIKDDWGVAAKLGILLSPTTLAYAKLGAIWANVTTAANVSGSIISTVSDAMTGIPVSSSTTSVSGSVSSSDNNKVAFLVGGGLEQYVWTNLVSFFIEYNYARFGTVSTDVVPVSGTTTVSTGASVPPTGEVGAIASSSRVRFNNVIAGFNFYFGYNWL